MALGYAEKLSYREDIGKVGMPELFDSTKDLNVKIDELAKLIQESRHLVAFTGAGISTSCGIPDFRGPKGVWTLQHEGKPIPKADLPFHQARPGLTHMALVALQRAGILKFIISQNIDGLHLKSGIPRSFLAELHGSSFREVCSACEKEYVLDFEVETIGLKNTGRRCSDPACNGKLKDTVLDWEDALPPKELNPAEKHCKEADVVLCLGTSLQITPACNLPLRAVRSGGKMVIVNLQATPKDKKAAIVIHARVDEVIAGVMQRLSLEIPPFVRVDRVVISCFFRAKPKNRTARWTLRVSSVHGGKAPLPFIGFVEVAAVWQHSKDGRVWKPCINDIGSIRSFQKSNGFIMIEANGGLNQQRSSICNAVAIAGLLNATLVIPHFHLNSVWQDPSSFGDIYDEEQFVSSLAENVKVVRQLPDYIMESFGSNASLIPKLKVKAWAPPSFYLEMVLPKLLETRVIRISPFANRLSFDDIPPRIQQLRCFANFESLRFAQPIADLGERLVERMKEHSANSDGQYIAVHLRFEEDMVAFSCCVYDGGPDEKYELDAAREKGWRGKFNKTGRVIDPHTIRMNGKCPLTPLEVGILLRGMGFEKNAPIFLASAKIYRAEKTMAPLFQIFPHLQTKETLLSPEELEPLKKFSSRLAALDYTACLHSEVFVTTQGGNFPQFLMGHRRYLNKGHSKTIKPDKRKLAVLLDTPDISWETFTRQLQAMRRHSDSKGHEFRKSSGSVFTYPAPDCMCSSSRDFQSSIGNETVSERSGDVLSNS